MAADVEGAKIIWSPAQAVLDADEVSLLDLNLDEDCFRRLSNEAVRKVEMLKAGNQYVAMLKRSAVEDLDSFLQRVPEQMVPMVPMVEEIMPGLVPVQDAVPVMNIQASEVVVPVQDAVPVMNIQASEVVEPVQDAVPVMNMQASEVEEQQHHVSALKRGREEKLAEDDKDASRPVKRSKMEVQMDMINQLSQQCAVLLARQIKQEKKQMEQEKRYDQEIAARRIYELGCTTPLSAAYSLLEVILDRANSSFRNVVAKALLQPSGDGGVQQQQDLQHHKQRWRQKKLGKQEDHEQQQHMQRFRASFSDGYIEDVLYIRAVQWNFKAKAKGMVDVWPKSPPLCAEWYDQPERDEDGKLVEKPQAMSKDLLEWLKTTEMQLAEELGVEQEELELLLHQYVVAVRLERNRTAHYFSAYEWHETRKKTDAKKGKIKYRSGGCEFPNSWTQCEERLKNVSGQVQEFKALRLEDLKQRMAVLEQLQEDVLHLNFFSPHQQVILAILQYVKSLFPGLTAAAVHKRPELYPWVKYEHDEWKIKEVEGDGWVAASWRDVLNTV